MGCPGIVKDWFGLLEPPLVLHFVYWFNLLDYIDFGIF